MTGYNKSGVGPTYPLGYVDGMNLYQAFGGNPVNFTDPWGEEAKRRLRPARAPERLKENPDRKKRLAENLEKTLGELAEKEKEKEPRRIKRNLKGAGGGRGPFVIGVEQMSPTPNIPHFTPLRAYPENKSPIITDTYKFDPQAT